MEYGLVLRRTTFTHGPAWFGTRQKIMALRALQGQHAARYSTQEGGDGAHS